MTDSRSIAAPRVSRPDAGPWGVRTVTHHPLMAPAVSAVGAIGVMAYVRLVSPYASGNYPTCPFLAVTGLYCPGCGSLRALHELANLDLPAALGMNVLAPLAVAYLLATWTAWTFRSATGRPRTRLAPPAVLWALLALIVVFTVARNVPALAPWLAPGVV